MNTIEMEIAIDHHGQIHTSLLWSHRFSLHQHFYNWNKKQTIFLHNMFIFIMIMQFQVSTLWIMLPSPKDFLQVSLLKKN
jgi:hypothetical protein